MTTSSGSQNVQSATITSPWAPAQPGLQSILSGLAGLNPQPTSQENAAIQQLQTNAGQIPNFGPTVANTAASYLGGDPYNIINPAYQQYGQSISGITNPNNLNPYNTPGFANALNTLNQDITNQVNGEFAAAGRSGSGYNDQTLVRGLAQGEGGLIQSQYNQNVNNLQNAAQNYFNAGIGANTALGQNTAAGATLGAAVPGLATQGPSAQLSAGQAPFGLVSGNLGTLGNITDPIAALGGQSNTNTQGQFTNTASPLSALGSIGGLFGGQFSPISGISNSLSGILGGLGNIFGPRMSWGG